MTQQLESGEVGKRADEYVLRLDQYNHHTFPIELTAGDDDTPVDDRNRTSIIILNYY